MVKHLPRNATARDVFEHFNNLYDLSKEDWTFNVRHTRTYPVACCSVIGWLFVRCVVVWCVTGILLLLPAKAQEATVHREQRVRGEPSATDIAASCGIRSHAVCTPTSSSRVTLPSHHRNRAIPKGKRSCGGRVQHRQ